LYRKIYQADGLLLLTAFIWGSAFVAQRVGMSHVGPLTFNGIRFALGALVLSPLARRVTDPVRSFQRIPQGMHGRPFLGGGCLAGGVLFMAATLQQVGLVYTTAGKAGFITGLYVIIVPLMGLLLGQRLGWGGWVGAILAAWGLYLLSVTESLTFAPGDLWVLGGAFFWAVHFHILGWLSPRLNGIRLARSQFVTCAFLSLAGAILTEEITPSGLQGAAVPILYGGVLSVGVAYTLQVVAQRHTPPAHAAIILSLEAVFAALAGWVVLEEVLALRSLIGCGLMLVGMLLAQLKGRPRVRTAPIRDKEA